MAHLQTDTRSTFLESFFDSCGDAVIITDLNKKIIHANSLFQVMSGYIWSTLSGMSIDTLIEASDFFPDSEEMTAGKNPMKVFSGALLAKGDLVKSVTFFRNPLEDVDGNLIGYAFILSTDRHNNRRIAESRQREITLQRVVDNINEGLIVDDTSGRVVYANDQFLHIFGLERADLNNLRLEDYVAPEFHQSLRDRHDRRIAGEDVPTEFQYVGLRKDGARRWIHVRVSEIREDGVVIGTQSAIHDITDKKLAEEALDVTLKEMTDYRYALDSACIVAITDAEGLILYVNDNFCDASGYTRQELIGSDHRIVNSGYHSREFFKDMWDTIKSGRIWSGELRNRTKSGEFYWVETTIVPFLDANGKPFRYISIRYNITERKVAQDRLIESERIHRTIVKNLPGAIITIIDRQNKYLMAEGEGIANLGVTREDYLQQRVLPFISADAMPRILEMREQAFNGITVSEDINFLKRVFRVRYIPLPDPDGQVVAIMSISIDITDLKEAELSIKELNESLEAKVKDRTLQLELANKELEAFSYSVSHDLRAPLRIINGFADILVTDYHDKLDDEGKRLLDRIMNNTQRMGKLIDELINLARLSRKEMVREETDMNKILSNVLEEQNLLWKAEIQVTMPLLPIVKADAGLIQQVWTNLISNAIKYAAKSNDRSIEIDYKTTETEYIFSVRDHGVGFDMEYKAKLFGVFQRLHKKNEFEGIGIGLALVKRIVLRHGGNVWADSAPGKGATFYFTLPK